MNSHCLDLSVWNNPNVNMSKSKCGECNVTIKNADKAMFCELCEVWKHTKCDKVRDDTYIMLNDTKVNDKRVHWFCNDCNEKAIKGTGIKLVLCLEKRTDEI